MNTKQQEFDAVVAHLYKQGKPAMQDGKCRYRTNDGLMCAVGCRIPNEAYDVSMEGRSVGGVMRQSGMPEELTQYSWLFSDLQSVHDSYYDASTPTFEGYLDEQLPKVARNHGLTFVKPV